MRPILKLLFSIAILSLFSACSLADLPGEVDAVLQDKLLSRADVGIDFVRLGDAPDQTTPIYKENATDELIPASNLKVVTTSAALDRLGPEFQFQTLLVQHGPDLIIIGDGDPTLGDAEMLKKSGWDVVTVFKAWADGLRKRNLATVRDVIVDDSVFDEQMLHPNWPADQTQKRYVAEIAGLNLNANCVDVYVHPNSWGRTVSFNLDPDTDFVSVRNTCVEGNDNAVWLSREPGSNDLVLRGTARSANDVPISVTVHDPPLYAGTVLAETLRNAGISVTGEVKRDRTLRAAYEIAARNHDAGWKLVAIHQTSLPSVIARANKDSMNLYAECVCKRLGFAATGQGTWATGTQQVDEFLQSIHVPQGEYKLDDGCGLSKENRVSAHLMVSVLEHDFYGKSAKIWMNSLAVAGEDGTLADRFRGTDLRGRVIAKSGFVNGVSCLSGYLYAKDNRWYCFSILFNGIPEGINSGAKTLEERLVRALDRYAEESTTVGAN
jgi:D-alanyl-D-alanine carboxypeptidase/D-alanyl-D-alanine-endopeptidase (penicillin-binding protein 4)